ncbi:hypothetical protein [Paenibacillus xylaniclasticus]|uniref:hypothetical protein n=1 Tax=Paenibacillus xylaniclasticus TaxID=588083 RepID=UPI000FDCD6B1|nr:MULTISPECIES: hypothetical protein [Paenibacillus]GFN32762.1 hypothetical protein PCURB6_30220 [Paenibacillus curdlanolyticus]
MTEIEEVTQATSRNSRKKKTKRWMKWTIIMVSVLLLLIIAVLGGGYLYIKSISLDDIKSRHSVAENNGSNAVEPAKIPKVMEGAVDKAADLAGEDIEGQDALDVAAILLNSGLSLRDIRYLQGNATYDLTTEEKQHIRELLLNKLKPDEIELLRTITSKYGKTLKILEPDYPIEWVGERDPEKIKDNDRKWIELQQKKKAAEAEENKDKGSGKEALAKEQEVSAQDEVKPSQPSTQLTDKQSKAKQAIDAKYAGKMSSLKSTCTAKSNALLQSILSDVASDPDISLTKLQSKFIGQLADAEGSCDSQFNDLLAKAQAEYADAGISAASMPDWSSEYNKAKSAARSAGISAIAGQLNKE